MHIYKNYKFDGKIIIIITFIQLLERATIQNTFNRHT